MTTIGSRRFLAIAAIFPIVALAAACGGDQTTASKSAAAFDAAVKQGVMPAPGEAHGGHGQVGHAEHSGAASDSHDGSSVLGMDHSRMPGMGTASGAHPAAGAGSSMAGMDHSRMPGMGTAPGARPAARATSSMAGMDHSRMPGMGAAPGAHPAAGAGSSMAGMDHSTIPGMDHTNMAATQGLKMAPPAPEPPTAAARPGQTAATLRPTELDQPPTTSLREAAHAAAMAEEMAGGGHGMMHGTYRQIDAGRDEVTPSSGAEHEGHQAAPGSPPPPGAGSHRDHSAPASPRPEPPRADEKGAATPPPGGHEHGQAPTRAQPSPSPAPHRMHSMPPSPRPTPTPRPEERPR